ncbi:exosome complex protein Rrp42 [Candidatus Aenigmatarchaeota archaeon]
MIELDNELVRKIVVSGKRLDNRKFDEYRKIEIEKDVVTSAEGSARVRLGDTEVIAGIKIDIGRPFPDTPDTGVLIVNAEFLPLASPDFESGPPGEKAIGLSRTVDRTIRESKAIDFKKLCIKPLTSEEEGKVWMVFIDVDVLNHDGNLVDAASIAAAAALMSAKIPDLDKDEKPIYDKKGSKSLPMTAKPMATTFVKINDAILSDPDLQEEAAADARITIGTVDLKGKTMLCAMQKGGEKGFTVPELEQIIDDSVKKGNELRKHLK